MAAGVRHFFGKPGELVEKLEYPGGDPDGNLITFDGGDMLLLSDDSTHRWLEPDERSTDSVHWHGVSGDLVRAMTTKNLVQDDTAGKLRQILWDECVAGVQEIANLHWLAGDKILVSAANSLMDSTLMTRHPSKAANGATKGLFFCSTLGGDVQQHDEAWDVIQVPLKAKEGRLLAMLRMVPLVAGRSDVAVAILNGDSRRPHNRIFEEMEQLEGVTYGTHKSGWNAANLGRFWAHGCVFRSHEEELRYAFAKYGHVYGTDEVWLLAHDPVAVVSADQMSSRRAVCWKPKTVVKNMKWIIWKKDPLNNEVYRMEETTVKDLCEMERRVFSDQRLTAKPCA